MQQLLRFLGLLLAGAALLRPGEVLAQGMAFSCDGTFYQIRQVNSTSQIFKVDRSTASYTTTPLNIQGGSNDLGVLVNGLAYNSQDGYLYALSTQGSGGNNAYTDISLYKIGQSGQVKVGGPITVNNAALGLVVASGTFDKAGNYYFTSQNTGTGTAAANYNVYRLQPTSSTPTAATQLTTQLAGGGANSYTFYDIAYNPIDNNLYGTLGTGSLYKIVLSGGTPTAPTAATVTQITPNSNGASPIGSAFFDVAGNMYGYSNGTVSTTNPVPGGFYSIDLSTGAYTLISSIDPASVSDGASCINPGSTIDVTKELTNVKAVDASTFDISYAIRVRNTYSTALANVQVSDILKGNTTTTTNVPFPTATAITIQGQPVVTNYDGATLVANANFNGLSTATTGSLGGGALLSGDQSLTAGQRALITYTVRVQFGTSAANVPTTARNNTAYATSTATSPNKGYSLLSNDVLLTPNDLVANDASTNTAAFPALRSTLTNGTPNPVDAPAPTPVTFAPSINGTVFEDVNYGGGLGRSLGTSQGVGRSGARVELYTGLTTAGVTTYTFDSFQLTAADGSYSFTTLANGNKLTSGANYVVRVVNSTVSSSRAGYAAGLLPVQTYRTSVNATNGTVPDPNRVGGEYPGRTDAGNGGTGTTLATLSPAAGTTAAESISYITAGTSTTPSPAVEVDFGYNFDTVVNTNDTGQGSLRQFITNANALANDGLAQAAASSGGPTPAAGVETSIFMVPDGKAHPGLNAYDSATGPNAGLASQLTNGVAVIKPATALPALGNANNTYAANTSIDGTTQTQNVGDTNSAKLGAGVNVGTSATTLAQVNGPEVQLTGNTNLALGLDVASTATNTTLKGLALYGFGNAVNDDNNALVRSNAAGFSITQSVLGSSATSFSAPTTTSTTTTNANALNIVNNNGGSATVSNNLIGFVNGKGIALGAGVVGASITGNEVRGNDQGNAYLAGLDIQGSSTVVSGNLFTGNAGEGINSNNSNGSNLISGNTVTGNGVGTANTGPVATSGIYVYGPSNTLRQNVVANNYGAGIMLNNGASATTISQNSIYGNGTVSSLNNTAASGDIGIDLQTNAQTSAAGTAPYVTLNSATTAGANGLVNYPVITSASVVGTNLLVQGYAKAGAAIELFTAQANPSALNATGANFGQGKTYLTTLTEGNTNTAAGPVDTNSGTGLSYSGNINGFDQGSDTNANGFSFSVPLSSLPGGTLALGTLLTATATVSSATSEFSGNVTTTPPALTGYVYEDVNYGGGLGRPRSASGTVTRPGAKVELYDANGNYVSTAITDANGQYTFNVSVGNYTVRVVNNSVLSSRTGATAASGTATTGYVSNQVPVQTYNGTTNRVGGENPAYTDALANSGNQTLASLSSGTVLPESIAAVSVSSGTANVGPDFGFNFDLVVNNNDAPTVTTTTANGTTTTTVTVTGNNAQGSLRQFIINSNALGGEASLAPVYTATNGSTTALTTGQETSIFMIPNGSAVAGQRAGLTNAAGTANFTMPNNGSGTAATITLAAALPAITGANTSLDGATQTRSTGDSNAATATANGESTGPEVLINASSMTTGNGASGTALTIAANDDQLLALGLYGATNGGGSVGVGISGGALRTIIQNSTINNNGANVTFSNSGTASAATISNNIIRDSRRGNADGIELNGGNSNMTISGNQLLRNNGFGIDFIAGANSGNTITNNIFSGNGTGLGNSTTGQGSGIGLRGGNSNNNVISNNSFTNNNGAGIIAKSGTTGNIFSQNSFSGNGTGTSSTTAGLGLGIDLMATGASGDNGDGVTKNDNGDADTGANGLINYPILQSAVINANGTVTVTGFARSNARVELYLAADDPTHFGEGVNYLTTFTQGSAAGTAGGLTTGAATTYSGVLNDGLDQGTDNTLTFTYTFTPTAAQLTQLQASSALLTSTATLTANDGNGNFGTSEFSGNARIFQAPVPNDATNASVPNNTANPVALNPNMSGTALGLTANVTTSTANSIVSYTVGLPSSGTLYYNNTPLTAATVIPAGNLNQLTFKPVAGSTNTVTFAYTALDANGLASSQHSASGTLRSGSAVYTIPVTAPLPVELVQFEAQAVLNRDAQLSWTTASELNNARFVVERSLDGVRFTPVGQLAGQGSTARATSYAFTDAGIGPKVAGGQPVYYRLQQVDQDGTVHYSPVRSVSFTKSAALALALYPNPTSAATGLDLSALPTTGTYQVLLLDATGRQVRQLTLGGGLVQHLELSDLATGTYQVLVSGQRPDGSVLRQVLRLIKE
ncbi:hypothetical protein HHL22_14500 [Hymenobacter sp. RP-2-7]|uniref:Right handed beta helix domain-containing protein n=1 Tax=Hymenobacter polaris TaxID=2682546 RepID=A0A7Y0FNF7_9BACT|nr:right-handed parallel beta-helix repeat-containing protein [Hymenobacter polaris]NML66419.1 hypothetical protein [Hymenobacter polaris]